MERLRRKGREEGGSLDRERVHQEVGQDPREHREDDRPVHGQGDVDPEDPPPQAEDRGPLEDPRHRERPREPEEEGMGERAVVEEPELRRHDRDRGEEGVEVRGHRPERHREGDLPPGSQGEGDRDPDEDMGEPVHCGGKARPAKKGNG